MARPQRKAKEVPEVAPEAAPDALPLYDHPQPAPVEGPGEPTIYPGIRRTDS